MAGGERPPTTRCTPVPSSNGPFGWSSATARTRASSPGRSATSPATGRRTTPWPAGSGAPTRPARCTTKEGSRSTSTPPTRPATWSARCTHPLERIVAWSRAGHDRRRPLILCEYGHAMGQCGGLADYWAVFGVERGLQGGFVWEWCDHALRRREAGRHGVAGVRRGLRGGGARRQLRVRRAGVRRSRAPPDARGAGCADPTGRRRARRRRASAGGQPPLVHRSRRPRGVVVRGGRRRAHGSRTAGTAHGRASIGGARRRSRRRGIDADDHIPPSSPPSTGVGAVRLGRGDVPGRASLAGRWPCGRRQPSGGPPSTSATPGSRSATSPSGGRSCRCGGRRPTTTIRRCVAPGGVAGESLARLGARSPRPDRHRDPPAGRRLAPDGHLPGIRPSDRAPPGRAPRGRCELVDETVRIDRSFRDLPRVGVRFVLPAGFERLTWLGLGPGRATRTGARRSASVAGRRRGRADPAVRDAPGARPAPRHRVVELASDDLTVRIAGDRPLAFSALHHSVEDLTATTHAHILLERRRRSSTSTSPTAASAPSPAARTPTIATGCTAPPPLPMDPHRLTHPSGFGAVRVRRATDGHTDDSDGRQH